MFNQIYRKILSEINDIEDISHDTSSSNFSNFNPAILATLLFQSINQFDLDPPPYQLLSYVINHLNSSKDNMIKITYKEIYQLLKNYDKQEKFKQNLSKLAIFYSGHLIVGICNSNLNSFKNTFKDKNISEKRLIKFFNYCKKSNAGNTLSTEPLNILSLKNTIIWLNKDFIHQTSNWTDTLTHELSHFVQRIANYGSDTPIGKYDKIILNDITGKKQQEIINSFDKNIEQHHQKIEQILHIFQNDFNFQQKVFYFENMLSQTLKIAEIKNTTENILNGFQRIYENLLLNKKDTLQYRNFWLNNFLTNISSQNFFNTKFGYLTAKEFFESSFTKMTNSNTYFQYKSSILIFQYLGINACFPEIHLNERLKQHFETFKFKDI